MAAQPVIMGDSSLPRPSLLCMMVSAARCRGLVYFGHAARLDAGRCLLEGFFGMASHLAILIIDDDETSAALLETYATSAGHAARRLAAATTRSDYILSLQPDVLLVALTGDNPENILTLCRAVSYNLLLCPIIMYGSAPDVDTMQLAMAAGVRRFLTAPVVREELLRAIVETRAQAERNQATSETRSPGGGTVMLPGGGAPPRPAQPAALCHVPCSVQREAWALRRWP